MYATYGDYLDGGGSMSEADYQRCGAQASRRIDAETFDRAAHAPPDMADRLKGCCCELADLFFRQEELDSKTAAGALTAASNDGISESYGNYGTARQNLHGKMRACLVYWLSTPVNLLYLGV